MKRLLFVIAFITLIFPQFVYAADYELGDEVVSEFDQTDQDADDDQNDISGMDTLAEQDQEQSDAPEVYYAEGIVRQLIESDEIRAEGSDSDLQQSYWQQRLRVELTKGYRQGETVIIDHLAYQQNWVLKQGDEITLTSTQDLSGDDFFQVSGFVRRFAIYWATLAVILVTLLVGGLKSLRSMAGLFISIAAIYLFLLPAILDGHSPMLMAALYALLVSLVVVPLALGINKKSLVAIIGIVGGSLVSILAAMLIGYFLHLSGIDDEESFYLLNHLGESFDFRGVLFAGILISSMGAVNDVAISIASSLQELSSSLQFVKARKLIQSGMVVGRDIIGSMIDTLVLAYVGASLPTILLFLVRDLGTDQIMNFDFIAIEVLRSLAGSLGIVIAVPITVLAGAIAFQKLDPPGDNKA